MSTPDFDCVVVGGGVIGAMSAWYLHQAGLRVAVLERATFGSGCSHANCGYLSPSHVLPLTTPGAVTKAMRSMLRPDSPFYVKPQYSASFWSWMWQFAKRCNERDMLLAAEGIHRLLESSSSLYRELISSQSLQCEWQRLGLLFVYKTTKEFEHYAETNRLTRDRFGVEAKALDSAELKSFEPALKAGLAGAWYFDCDSHLRPDRLMSEMKRLLVSVGVTVQESCFVSRVRREGSDAVAVQTSRGEISAGHFLFATGATTPFLRESLGVSLPIQPGKGYSLTMPRPSICPKYPIIFEEHRVAITPMETSYRIGSTMEFSGYDTTIHPRRLGLLRSAAELYLEEPYADPVEETWFGWRPMTWDSLPFLGRAPLATNVWVAAGHNMLGISTATATGKLMAELITGQTPHIPPEPYRLERIG